MDRDNTLGIVVNSNRYFSFVTKMADAAMQNGRQVRLCLLGSGIAYTETKAFTRLSGLVSISVCAEDTRRFADREKNREACRFDRIPPQELSALLAGCGRYVVF